MIRVLAAVVKSIRNAAEDNGIMPTIIIIFGVLCLGYYLVLVKCTGKWSTTFSGFWVVLGVANIGFGLVVRTFPDWLHYAVAVLAFIPWFVFIIVELMICFAMFTHPPKRLDYIIILGAQVRGAKITDSLKRRLDRGLRYLQENANTKVIVSGGQGRGEDISEAKAMGDYLMSCGIAEDRIILEDKSTSTKENLSFSKQYLDIKRDKLGIVSNNFHIYRAAAIAKQLQYSKIYGMAASCRAVILPNYMVREFFAVLYLQFISRKQH